MCPELITYNPTIEGRDLSKQLSADEVRKLGEEQNVEFKQSLSLRREAMEALCGMVNTDYGSGTVLFGVSDDGSCRGIDSGNLDTAQRTLAQYAANRFDPSLICDIQVITCEGKTLISLKASRASNTAYHEYQGRAYIREGTQRRPLNIAEKQHLRSTRLREAHNGPWRCSGCGTVVGMLSQIIVTDHGVEKSYDCFRCGGEFQPLIG